MPKDDPLTEYLATLRDVAQHPEAREHGYRTALETLLKTLAGKSRKVLHEPAGSAYGRPDFTVYQAGTSRPVGYVETKDLGHDLAAILETPQLLRYRKALPNLLVTNYLEFRLLRDGEPIEAPILLLSTERLKQKRSPAPEAKERFEALCRAFLDYDPEPIRDPGDLARALATKARLLDAILNDRLADPGDRRADELRGLHLMLRKALIPALRPEEFADVYAQTITYGLFLARLHPDADKGFSRGRAIELLPPSNDLLREIFTSSVNLHPAIEWVVSDVVELLATADMKKIAHAMWHASAQADPAIHFYEPFLEVYDADTKGDRGVYYTPQPIVDFIIRGVEAILEDVFGRPAGLAEKGVTVLDPACGTGTFLASAVRAVHARMERAGDLGRFKSVVKKHVLPEFFGFELLMAPYVVAHLKLASLLRDLGASVDADSKLNVLLTNTLLGSPGEQAEMLFGVEKAVADEGRAAQRVKDKQPILVVLGNPPYSGHTYNPGYRIDDYKSVAGQPIDIEEKWLNNDYVKFIRWAEYKVTENPSSGGAGVVAMITDNSFLDASSFRGMRWHLLQQFSEVHVVNLRGNQRKHELCPDGSPDEKVFKNVQQGVVITVLVRRPDHEGPGTLRYWQFQGRRAAKFSWLQEQDFRGIGWTTLAAEAPDYYFLPVAKLAEYDRAPAVPAFFAPPSGSKQKQTGNSGITVGRDEFATDRDPKVLLDRIRRFGSASGGTAERIVEEYGLHDTRDWKIDEARAGLTEERVEDRNVMRILFRAFDIRWIYYSSHLLEYDRRATMRHLVHPQRSANPEFRNLALITLKTVAKNRPFSHVYVTRELVNKKCLSGFDNCFVWPLWNLYSTDQPIREVSERVPFVKRQVLDGLRNAYKRDVGPEDVFSAIYGTLRSPSYRQKFQEQLRYSEFPRVILPKDPELFRRLAELGGRLVRLHLLEGPGDAGAGAYPIPGSNAVEKVRYDAKKAALWINKEQRFEGISSDVWDYRVGDYQTLRKYLVDREKSALLDSELDWFSRVIKAVASAVNVEGELAKLWDGGGESVLASATDGLLPT